MSQTTELIVKLKAVGGEQLTQLAGKLNNLGRQSKAASTDFKSLGDELRKTQATSVQSINNLRGYANAWREIANSVDVASKEFKDANAEALKLERQLEKTTRAGRRPTIRGATKIVGTALAGGIFGGPEGFIGGLAGGLIGGLPGAAAGAAIGGGVSQARQQLSALATYAADLDKQRTALAGLTKNYKEYQSALSQVEKLSQQFAIPQEIITRQFTKLAASVLGAGGNLQDTEKAFKGVAAGIRGTGGDLQDLESALTATAQVFSKGKVSAEELRQQIGERLPGAFTLFAQSLNMTPAELDKALEDGKVSLQDFQKFSELLFQRFGKSAEAIVKSPAAAGDRLQTALSKLNENVGRLLAPIGAAFQNVFAAIVIAINQAASALVRFFNLNIADRVEEYQERVTSLEESLLPGKAQGRARGSLQQQLTTARLNLKMAQEQRALRMAGAQKDRKDGGLPGIVPDAAGAGAGGRGRQAKQIKDITAEELELKLKINMAQRAQNERQEAYYTKQLTLLQIAREEIGPNERKAQTMDAVVKYATTLKKINEEEAKVTLPSIVDRIADLASGYGKAIDLTVQLTEQQKKQKELADGIATTMGEGMASAFDAIIQGSEDFGASLRRIASGVLIDIANQLLQVFVIQKAINAISGLFGPKTGGLAIFNPASFSMPSLVSPLSSAGDFSSVFKGTSGFANFFGGARANGGSVIAGRSYLVGERGPELFMPNRTGNIVPNGNLGGASVVVNVDATGTAVQGDQNQAKALGAVIGAAVQAELIKQKKPGGLLY